MPNRSTIAPGTSSSSQSANKPKHHKSPLTPHSAGRSDDADAFIRQPQRGEVARTDDDLAEALGEGFITAATSAEEMSEDVRDEVLPEEYGGPFTLLQTESESVEGDPDPDELARGAGRSEA